MHREQREDRLIKPGHFVGLKFQDGWWFIQSLTSEEMELKPWVLLNENGNRDVIAANTAGDRDEFLDGQGRKLLEPDDEERELVFQLLFGVEPSRMELYPEFGREQNLGLEEDIEPGGDEKWVTGFDSPYNNPSLQSEVIYVNDMPSVKIQAFNPMDTADEARLSIHINKIGYATITDVNLMKAMLQGQIPAHKHEVGLGAEGVNQVTTPQWLSRNFGEHIHSTREILDQGDASQAQQGGQADRIVGLPGSL